MPADSRKLPGLSATWPTRQPGNAGHVSLVCPPSLRNLLTWPSSADAGSSTEYEGSSRWSKVAGHVVTPTELRSSPAARWMPSAGMPAGMRNAGRVPVSAAGRSCTCQVTWRRGDKAIAGESDPVHWARSLRRVGARASSDGPVGLSARRQARPDRRLDSARSARDHRLPGAGAADPRDGSPVIEPQPTRGFFLAPYLAIGLGAPGHLR